MVAPAGERERSASPDIYAPLAGRAVFSGSAWVGGQWQQAECLEFPDEYRVQVGLGPIFSVGRPGGEVACLEPCADDSPLAQEALDGPAGILSNALRGVFRLHSSASYAPHGGIAFIGPSGRGKSTMADLLEAAGWPRLADDILRLHIDGASGASVLVGAETSSRLAAIYLLADETATVQSRRLRGIEAVRTLVEQSIGTRLFGSGLLRAHFEFCGQLCALVPIYRLDYPRRRDIGATVRTLIRADADLVGDHAIAD